jgi:DNA-repair protein XRCC1
MDSSLFNITNSISNISIKQEPENTPIKQEPETPDIKQENVKNKSKIFQGMEIAISGLENPERSIIREMALEMDAQYHSEWNENCTVLICPFKNTPKTRLALNSMNALIIHPSYVQDCYEAEKRLDLSGYLMHAREDLNEDELKMIAFNE